MLEFILIATQQSMKHASDTGDSARIPSSFYTLAFFWLDGFAVPAPAQVTQTVRRQKRKYEK